MKNLNFYENRYLKYSLNLEKFKYVDVGLSILESEPNSELQFIGTSKENHREIIYSEKINEGNIVSVCLSDGLIDNLFFLGKESHLREIHQKSNLGNACNKHLHTYVDENYHSITYANEKSGIQFNSTWDSEGCVINYSIGTFNSHGTEQWHQSFTRDSVYIEFLYLLDK